MKYFVVAVSSSINYRGHPAPIMNEDDVIALYDSEEEAMAMAAQSGQNRRVCKIDMKGAKQIRKLRKNGFKIEKIAERFKLTTSAVRLILAGKRWRKGDEDYGYKDTA